MKIAVHLARHRRLLALGGLSLLLHLLALAWMGGRSMAVAPLGRGEPLALRLALAAAVPTAPSAQEPDAPAASMPAQGAAAPSAVADTPPALPPMQPLLPAAENGAPPAPVQTNGPGVANAAPPPRGDPHGATLGQMPGRYQVRTPPSARLTYAVSHSGTGTEGWGSARPGSADAQLVWETRDGKYHLRVEGVLGLLESEGAGDDAGIAPSQASEQPDGSGPARLTRFNRENGRIEGETAARSDPLFLGTQDRASLLMQLAAIGLGAPEQMQDVIEIMVGTAHGAEVVRLRVLGHEQLATGAGTLATVRLAELPRPGARGLEIWLAPDHNWMPVQLRVTAPDGSVANQVLTGIETEAAAPAPVM